MRVEVWEGVDTACHGLTGPPRAVQGETLPQHSGRVGETTTASVASYIEERTVVYYKVPHAPNGRDPL